MTRSAPAAFPVLSAPEYREGELRFALRGESKVGYQILSSTNLVDWSLAVSNAPALASHRRISVRDGRSQAYVRARRDPVLPWRFALAVADHVDLGGYALYVDSFDSADPAASTQGRYDRAKRRANADLAAPRGVLNTQVGAGELLLLGGLATGPTGEAALGANGAVGNLAWVAAGATGIQPGAWVNDLHLEMPLPQRPAAGAFTPSGGFVDGSYYDFILADDVDYSVMFASGAILVTGHAVLTVTSNLHVSIEIAEGASLRLACGGASAVLGGSIRGQGLAVLNRTGRAANFTYVNLASEQRLRLVTSSPFIGTIYAPGADVFVEGDPGAGLEFIGSCWADSLQLRSPLQLHYDENLPRIGPAPER